MLNPHVNFGDSVENSKNESRNRVIWVKMKEAPIIRGLSLLVRKGRLELPRALAHMNLNHARLPIPPLRPYKSVARSFLLQWIKLVSVPPVYHRKYSRLTHDIKVIIRCEWESYAEYFNFYSKFLFTTIVIVEKSSESHSSSFLNLLAMEIRYFGG